MRTARRQRLHLLGAAFLAALLFVPILASGHRHAAHATPSCATCAVTQHTPVLSPSRAAIAASTPLVLALVPLVAASPSGPVLRRPPSRAPPALRTEPT